MLYFFFPKVLHLVNYFVKHFFVWNKSWLCTTDKTYCFRWYDSYRAFQCNRMLLAWIKGTFNSEEGFWQESSVQSVMHRIIGYTRVSSILYSNWKFEILLNLPNWNTYQWKIYQVYPCYGITQHCRFECVKYHMRILVCSQFTKYSLVFMWHVVTANKFGKVTLDKTCFQMAILRICFQCCLNWTKNWKFERSK